MAGVIDRKNQEGSFASTIPGHYRCYFHSEKEFILIYFYQTHRLQVSMNS
jgi:hypothetical protein